MPFCSLHCVSQSAISLALCDHTKYTLCLERPAYSEGLGWIAVQSMWDLWWIKWHYNGFLPKYAYFGSPFLSNIPPMLHTR